MKAYRIVQHGGNTRYAGSMADAKEEKYKMNEAAGLPRTARAGIAAQIEDVEIPTNKEGLLKFINDLVAQRYTTPESPKPNEQ